MSFNLTKITLRNKLKAMINIYIVNTASKNKRTLKPVTVTGVDTQKIPKTTILRIKSIKETLAKKGNEYSKDKEVFKNFIDAGRKLDTNKYKALQGMLIKHIVSVDNIIDNIEQEVPTVDIISEKIGDIINYYILLEAMLIEEFFYNEQLNSLEANEPNQS